MYDATKAVDIVYLDFQKAFDKVPHRRLLGKLKSYGIDGKLLKWLEDWLSERKQRDVLNGKSLNWKVLRGVLLGSVLFLIYVNDINEGFTCKVSKYVDDTKIMNKAVTSEDKR